MKNSRLALLVILAVIMVIATTVGVFAESGAKVTGGGKIVDSYISLGYITAQGGLVQSDKIKVTFGFTSWSLTNSARERD
ncbi:hypothetical protein ACFLYL_04340 [Chloroflexota bacterium]